MWLCDTKPTWGPLVKLLLGIIVIKSAYFTILYELDMIQLYSWTSFYFPLSSQYYSATFYLVIKSTVAWHWETGYGVKIKNESSINEQLAEKKPSFKLVSDCVGGQATCTMIKLILLNYLLKYVICILHQIVHVLTSRSTCFITTAAQESSQLISYCD